MELLSRIIAFILLIVLSPFLIIISTICLIFQGYPILFKQKRVGFQYRTFKIYKFRTMKVNSGPLITKERDARITFIGWLLRKFKIDEIPQLLNILKGEMRFIGPRPEVLEYFEESSFSFLKKIKPGISDFSSIIFRDESKVLDKLVVRIHMQIYSQLN
jgi:Sugar transferases involved in lipopolysaccharide synthesis